MSRTVLVVGTGTIGEPLIGILSRLKSELDITNVIFHKRTPLELEVAKVKSMTSHGALLAVDTGMNDAFEALGHKPDLLFSEALEAADVVIDCTPAGNKNKEKYYSQLEDYSKTYIAQGSEKGFGIPYALGINDVALREQEHKYIQIVSCNTHAISSLIRVLAPDLDEELVFADFVCVRRANDASQDDGYIPSPQCGVHDDPEFGTHHARDVNDILKTVCGSDLPVTSSAMKVNSQYMHSIRFALEVKSELELEDVMTMLSTDRYITLTGHTTANKVFSFGRDHGFYGRIYNQVVVNKQSISTVRLKNGNTRIVGFAFTPQDGNSLLSSLFACLYGLDGKGNYLERTNILKRFLKNEI